MEEANYWNRLSRRRLSRRRLLTGAALTGSGLAAAAVIGCGSSTTTNDDSGGGLVSDADDPNADVNADAINPYDARREVVPAPDGMTGGFLRYQGFDPVVLDRHDPHQTQFGPMYANLSSVFSKLYAYKSHSEPTWENIVPDLAADAPEMIGDPNAPTEYVVKLRQGIKFHNSEKARNFDQAT